MYTNKRCQPSFRLKSRAEFDFLKSLSTPDCVLSPPEGPGGGPLQGAEGQAADRQRQQLHRQSAANSPRRAALRAGRADSQLPAPLQPAGREVQNSGGRGPFFSFSSSFCFVQNSLTRGTKAENSGASSGGHVVLVIPECFFSAGVKSSLLLMSRGKAGRGSFSFLTYFPFYVLFLFRFKRKPCQHPDYKQTQTRKEDLFF